MEALVLAQHGLFEQRRHRRDTASGDSHTETQPRDDFTQILRFVR